METGCYCNLVILIYKSKTMKKVFILLLLLVTISLNAALVNKSGNVLRVKETSPKHVLISIYENGSDTAKMIVQFSTYIGNQLQVAKDEFILSSSDEGKTASEIELNLLEAIIIKESLNGGLLKYKPDLDIILIEDLDYILLQ